jgi:PAS domain S-box-containing protein
MDLSGYWLETLREDSETVLYRGHEPDTTATVLVIAPASRKPAAAHVERLEHEYALRNQLDPGWAVEPLGLARHQGRTVLVLRDPGGQPLDRQLGRPLDLAHFLNVAVGLSAALRHVHAAGFIHKDIKPGNVFVDESGNVRLTGFGFATRIPRERQAPAAPEVIAGTLAYIAPEQTGRMNRSIDSRCDLYALGVTLYEMLVGALPFAASKPMEWIYCHVARSPPPPSVRVEGVPPAIELMILKLLAKNAEDRYQTAAGIEYDLRHCLTDLRAVRRIEQFPLASRDRSEQLRIPEKLYGRESELRRMIDAYEHVATHGAFQFMLVSGTAGVGKSSLVNELHRALHSSRGVFAAGRFERHKKDIPYATLSDAFRGLVRQIMSRSDEELGRWRSSLQHAVGRNGQLLVDLLPELGRILGNQPPLLTVSPQEARNRFHFVFRRFVATFAQPEHPLVLFLDDLQWLDAATLELLRALVADEDIPYLFLIGAHRNHEVESPQELSQLLEVMNASRRGLQYLLLEPLSPRDIGSLVADALHADLASVTPLADVVFQKTHGNPFFATQFLTSLNTEGLICLDRQSGVWQWQLDRIRAKGITDNVAQLMAEKLVGINATALEVITRFACLANGAQSTALSKVFGVTEEAVDTAMHEFVAAGLVHRVERGYTFAHDGVREAAYARIPESQRASLHLEIGRLLSNALEQSEIEDDIFEIVHQFNRGASRITASEERQRLAAMNLIAGKRAEAAAAYDSALTYFEAGCGLLTQNSWEQHYRTTFDLELHRAECRFMAGDFSFTEERLRALSERSTDVSDMALIVSKQIILYTYMGRMERAIEISIECLARMNVILPLNPTEDVIEGEYRRMRERLGERGTDTISALPVMQETYWRAVTRILEELVSPTGTINPDLHALVVLRMVNISLDHGVSNESCHSYSNLGGQILGWRFGSFEDGQRFGALALKMVERGLSAYAARVYAVISGTVGTWTFPLRDSYELAVRATDADRAQGGIIYSGYAWATGLTALLASGHALPGVQQYAETGLAFSRKSRFSLLVECINPTLFLVRALRGMTLSLGSFSDPGFDADAHEQHLESTPHLWHGLVRYRIRKLQMHYWAGNYTQGFDLMPKLEAAIPLIKTFEFAEYLFFAALTRAAILTMRAPEYGTTLFDALKMDHHRLTQWASLCPTNFLDRACLVGAEIARLEGSELIAEGLYEEAIRQSRKGGFLQNEGLAFELSARFYEARGFEVTAEAYLRNARSCYLRWGADAKVRQLDEQYPHLSDDPSVRLDAAGAGGTRLQNLDIAAVIDMHQAVSGEIVFERLIERLMVTVVQHAGAVRGLLLLSREGKMNVVAEAATHRETVTVSIRHQPYEEADLPRSVVNYVTRTHEYIIIDDASVANPHSSDAYIQRSRPRAVLCLPLLKQNRCVGVLYLENNLSSHIFTPDRVSVLQLVASQAGISIENAELFSNIQATQEHARRVGEELQRSFDMIPALAWRAAADGTMEVANRRWVDYTGVVSEETRTGTWIRSFHPNDVAKVVEKWRHLSEFRTSGEFEARMRRFDGEFRYFLVRITPTLDEAGNVLNWHGTHTDIDDLKHAQDSLRMSEAELAEGQSISHTGSWAWNAKSDMVSWSEECARIFGCSPLERTVPYSVLLGRIHPEDRSLVEARRGEAMSARKDYSVEHRIVLPDGTTRTVLHRGRHIEGWREKAVEYIGSILDVTEQRRNENQMREAQAALSRVGRLTALGELTASIAHEVNQPLMAIVTNAATCLQWLADEQLDVEAARVAAKRIIRDGRRAGDVINSIRAMAKKTPPEMAELDINAAILEVIALTHNELERHAIAVMTEFGADATPVLGDKVQMQQVILNLIMNGIEAINAAPHQPRHLKIQSKREESGCAVVTITDTGIGLNHTSSEKVFEAFFTTKADGIGIGLSICRSIVEAHRGRIWASPNPPRGTSFHFTLPMYGLETSAPTVATFAQEEIGPRVREER